MLTIHAPFYDVTYLEILNLGIFFFFTKENIIKVSFDNYFVSHCRIQTSLNKI